MARPNVEGASRPFQLEGPDATSVSASPLKDAIVRDDLMEKRLGVRGGNLSLCVGWWPVLNRDFAPVMQPNQPPTMRPRRPALAASRP